MAWGTRRSARQREDETRDVDQALADLSQSHADADQTASDTDAGASERDRGSALSDQAASDLDQQASDADQASSDRDLAAGGDATSAEREVHDDSRLERAHARDQRDDTRQERTDTEIDRIRADAERFETSAQRDDVAAERDRAAALRESAAQRSEAAMLAADPGNRLLRAAVAANSEQRDRAMADRRRAASDRQQAAEDRLSAAAAQRQARIDIQRAQMSDSAGVYARQVGFAALRGEIDRCNRADDPFVLAYIGIDGLPDLKARQGLPAGEALIESVVGALREKLRSYDPVVRVDEQEFVCGLSGTEPEAAHERVEEIRRAVRDGHPPGTISVGFAVLDAGDRLGTLLARAQADMRLDSDDGGGE